SLFLRPRSLPCLTPFPYTTLFRSEAFSGRLGALQLDDRVSGSEGKPGEDSGLGRPRTKRRLDHRAKPEDLRKRPLQLPCGMGLGDRKSTRLNSSHVKISYAVFCLK